MRKGFTLIELLVVIAIIAILAAILFPVFARAREKARSAACQSNLKQIALAVLMYVQDYDERFPKIWHHNCPGSPAPNPANWKDVCVPYIKNAQLWACPSTDLGPRAGCSSRGAGVLVDGYGGNIGRENLDVDGACDGDVGLRGPFASPWLRATAIADCMDVAGTILVFESSCTMNCGYNWGQGVYMLWPHNEGMNVAFVDGHVKWQRQTGWGPLAPAFTTNAWHLMTRANWTNRMD
jgi:prepilin-type N-terminal cleavage/methylation domain-containing protein/prepilin-type processing-associated H-X9-DG protein